VVGLKNNPQSHVTRTKAKKWNSGHARRRSFFLFARHDQEREDSQLASTGVSNLETAVVDVMIARYRTQNVKVPRWEWRKNSKEKTQRTSPRGLSPGYSGKW
jgi:hypothetical protein